MTESLSGKRIAVIGAGYLQLPLVLKANQLGVETYCFAYEEGAVCREHCTEFFPISIVEVEPIVEQCRKLAIDGVTSIASDVAVPTMARVAAELGLIGNSIESAHLCTHKLAMKRRLRAQGLPVADFWDEQTAASASGFPLVVKPVDRSGSAAVRLVRNQAELDEAIENAKATSLSGECIIEAFVTASEISVESMSVDGHHEVLAITDKVISGPPSFVELEHHQPTQLPEAMKSRVEVLTKAALDALEVTTGAAHTEFLLTSDGEVLVTELGARMGGDFIGSHLVQLSTGYDFLQAVIEASLGADVTAQIGETACSGVLFASAEGEIELDNIPKSAIVEQKTTGERKSTLGRSGDRHGYLIYQHSHRLTRGTP